MKILTIADIESKSLWDYFDPSKVEGVDLILSAGDLNPNYLSFLATFCKAPILYVHGNHDECYDTTPPEGCTCIDDSIYEFQGVRIMGLGGSNRYKPGRYMYNELQMKARALRLSHKAHFKGVDIILAHSPIAGFHDMEDLPHQGFETLGKLCEKYHPDLLIHGHVHMNYGRFPREDDYKGTRVINAYEKYIFDYEPTRNNNKNTDRE
ncbi:MAG: metallophosphoesterase family protein [Lachnospiraceae bacterium]|nr:metallophosphoesterase family protein [Lachnospiraceae bacterium]